MTVEAAVSDLRLTETDGVGVAVLAAVGVRVAVPVSDSDACCVAEAVGDATERLPDALRLRGDDRVVDCDERDGVRVPLVLGVALAFEGERSLLADGDIERLREDVGERVAALAEELLTDDGEDVADASLDAVSDCERSRLRDLGVRDTVLDGDRLSGDIVGAGDTDLVVDAWRSAETDFDGD